jgi:hypothetical protein
LWIATHIEAGVLGSPILDAAGLAIGIASSSGEGIPNPRLADHLPEWLLGQLLKPPVGEA